MIEHLTLEQMREFLDGGRYSIIPDEELGSWVRIRRDRVEAAFKEGLAPFSALTRFLGSDPVYELPQGETFVPLQRATTHPPTPVVRPYSPMEQPSIVTVDRFYRLSPQDLADGDKYGRLRREVNLAAGSHNKQLDTARGVAVEIEGMNGEIAFCRLFGLEPDFSTQPRRGSPDCRYAGLGIDVKATSHPLGRLMVYKPKRGENNYADIDAFGLVRLHRLPIAHIVGYALKERVLRDENVQDVDYGPTWFLENKEWRLR